MPEDGVVETVLHKNEYATNSQIIALKAGKTTIKYTDKHIVQKRVKTKSGKKKTKKVVQKTIRKYKITVYEDPAFFQPDLGNVAQIDIRETNTAYTVSLKSIEKYWAGAPEKIQRYPTTEMESVFEIFREPAQYPDKLPSYMTEPHLGGYGYFVYMYDAKGKLLYQVALELGGYLDVYYPLQMRGLYKGAVSDFGAIDKMFESWKK